MANLKTRGGRRGWLLLAAGLGLFLVLQGLLVNLPLAGWSLMPELDDSLTYVLKTRQMQECWRQTCPALVDLHQQLFVPAADPAAARQLDLARSRLFPVYHPLFSLLLLAVSQTGLGLMEAYRWLWRLSPLIFGGAFAYLLTKLTEPGAAGIALALLAFKVFPDTGLHHLVPSNLTMAAACLVWGRILARQGWAPWTLAGSAVVLPALHPVGVLYTAVSMGLALWLASPTDRKKVAAVVGFMLLVIAAIFGLASWVKGVALVRFTLIPPVPNPVAYMIAGAGKNVQALAVEIIRSDGGLFGSPPIFLAAVVLGFLGLAKEKRRLNSRLLLLNALLLLGLLFYVSSHPGDVILRIWIPLVVILFGLVGHGFIHAGRLSREAWRDPKMTRSGQVNLLSALPVLLLALLLGYALQMAAVGTEQVVTYIDHLRKRQPLVLTPAQPELLLGQAQAGDRVFYNSLILMPYYFVQGSMQLGAVYYHPALQGSPVLEERLRQPELRFAVTYNPTVYHPSFAGQDEPRWWITSPSFRYSPLDRPRRFGPLAREGKIALADFQWLEIHPNRPDFPKTLKIRVDNAGEKSALALVAVSAQGEVLSGRTLTVVVPGQWQGWLEVDLAKLGEARRFRLGTPPGVPAFQISGLVLGEQPHLWPWAQRATLTARPRDPGAPEIVVSFDPRDLLPPPLQAKRISILDDTGSAVLLRLD